MGRETKRYGMDERAERMGGAGGRGTMRLEEGKEGKGGWWTLEEGGRDARLRVVGI